MSRFVVYYYRDIYSAVVEADSWAMSRFVVYYYRDIYSAVVEADSPEDAIEALDHGCDEITALWVEDENEEVVWRPKR